MDEFKYFINKYVEIIYHKYKRLFSISGNSWVGDVGSDPLHGTSPGKISTRGCKADNWDTAEETGGGGW